MDTSALKLGTWGCSHGSGFLGDSIRKAEQSMSKSEKYPQGDHQASWAGHCFVFVGNQILNGVNQPCIIEAEYPKAKLSPVTAHADAIWATGQKLSVVQRQKGAKEAMSLLGAEYGWADYAFFLAKVAGMRWSKSMTALFTDDRWVICSGVVVMEQKAMGVPLGALQTAATWNPNFVAPADCLRWGLDNGWMSKIPPADWT